MKYLRVSRNKTWLRLITFILITIFLCPNIAWANDNRLYQTNLSSSKLATRSLFKFINAHCKDKDRKTLIVLTDILDGFLTNPQTRSHAFTMHELPKIQEEWKREVLGDFFKVTGSCEEIEKDKIIEIPVELNGISALLYFFRDDAEININEDMGIRNDKDLAIASTRRYWFHIVSDSPEQANSKSQSSVTVKPLNILLVVPPAQAHRYSEPIIPLGTSYLAGALRNKRNFQRKLFEALGENKPQYKALKMYPEHNVVILDLNIKDDDFDLKGYLRELNVKLQESGGIHMVGVSSNSTIIEQTGDILRAAKEVVPDALRVTGGVHPSALPKETIETLDAEVVVIGEGEETISEIAMIFSLCERNKESLDLSDVQGCVYKDRKGKVQINGPRMFALDLDAYPWASDTWDLLEVERYQPEVQSTTSQPGVIREQRGNETILRRPREAHGGIIRGPMAFMSSVQEESQEGSRRWAFISTVRGCPYNCAFCATKLMSKRVRYRSPEDVVAEMKRLYREYQIEEFVFGDETFTANRKRVERFVELLKDLRDKDRISFTWTIQTRADRLDEELLLKMKEVGLQKIDLGIETVDKELSRKLGKGLDMDKVTEAVEAVIRLDFLANINLMVGLPGQRWLDILKTVRWLEKLQKKYLDKTVRAARYIAIPYPGTRLYREKSVQIRKPGDNYPIIHQQWMRLPLGVKDKVPRAVTETDDMSTDEIGKACELLDDPYTRIILTMENPDLVWKHDLERDLQQRAKPQALRYAIADMICRAQEDLTKEKRLEAWRKASFHLQNFNPPQDKSVIDSIIRERGIPQDEGTLDRICDFVERVSFENGYSFMGQFQNQREYVNWVFLNMALWHRLGKNFGSIRFLHGDALISPELREFLWRLDSDKIIEFGLQGKDSEYIRLTENGIVINGTEIPCEIKDEKLLIDLTPFNLKERQKEIVVRFTQTVNKEKIQAKPRKTILALDSDIGRMQDYATSLLAELSRQSAKGNLGNIHFVRSAGNDLESEIKDKIQSLIKDNEIESEDNVDIVLVAKEENLSSGVYMELQGKDNIYITAVNDRNIKGRAYIPMLEILTFALEIAFDDSFESISRLYKEITKEELGEEEYRKFKENRISISLILPTPKPIDLNTLRDVYEASRKLLAAA